MDVRLGVTHSTKELVVDLGDDVDSDAVREQVDSAMANRDGILWLTDRKGRRIGVPVDKLSHIEIGSSDNAHRVGFGS